MSYWLCTTDERNWCVAKNKRIWGLAQKAKTYEQLKMGDYVVFYVKRGTSDSGIIQPKITGIFKVSSKPFYDEKELFAVRALVSERIRQVFRPASMKPFWISKDISGEVLSPPLERKRNT
jgi:predicted RNA-binding protein